MYTENPKTKGSGIICAIPQTGMCPNKCSDCFFQSGRSYLEPLENNLPNLPSFEQSRNRVVRINDGNDSNINIEKVLELTEKYEMKFFNTAIPKIQHFKDPGVSTNIDFYKLEEPLTNLMFVRFRCNTWNLNLLDDCVKYYTRRNIPVVITFMAFYVENIPEEYKDFYEFRKRTLNSYWCLKPEKWEEILNKYKNNDLVYCCGKNAKTHSCQRCGNCLREYFNTKERMNND